MKYLNLIFIFTVLLITIGNLLWVNLNKVPPYYDSAGHTNLAFEFADVFTGKKALNEPLHLFKITNYYPPFVFVTGGVITSLLGYDYKVLEYTSVLLLPLAALFLYFYVWELTRNKSWAVFSAASFVVLPNIWEPSHRFMLDLPLTLLIILSLYALEKFKNTQRFLFLFLSILFLTFAQLTKWYAVVYLFIPFVSVIYGYIKNAGMKKMLGIFLLPVIVGAMLTLPWYLINLNDLLFWTSFFSHPHFGNAQSVFSLRSFLFYPTMLLNYQIVSFQFIIFMLSCVYFFKNKPKGWILFALELLTVFLVFTLLGNKNVRFTMPLLLFLSVILGYGMTRIWQNGIGKIVVFGFFIFSFLFYLINSFGIPVNTNLRFAINFNNKLDNIYFLDLTSKDIPYRLNQQDWNSSKIIEDIEANGKGEIKVLVVSNNPYVSVGGLEVFNRDKKRVTLEEVPLDRLKSIKDEDVKGLIEKYDFLLIPDQSVAPAGQQNYFNLEVIRQFILAGKTREFALIGKYSLPNNDTLYLLKKDLEFNLLEVMADKDKLRINRHEAVANIYLQFMDPKFNWTQEAIEQHQVVFDKDMKNFVRFRIDYPSYLIRPLNLDGWKYDYDKQFDHVDN